ncbi:MAG: PAS domain S-box protein [Bacteroidota bacterium]|nr:PAS domain S-box protein [Bacteroidota bacterium]
MLSNQYNEKSVRNNLKIGGEIDKLKIDQQSINLFMQAPVGICLLQGAEFKITLANEATLDLWGKGKDVIGKTILEAIPEIIGQGYLELLEKVMTTGEPVKFYESEIRLLRNGVEEVLYVNFLYQPYYEMSGVVSGVLAIAMEVTETVVSRKKTEESETRLRNIIEQTPTPILILKGEELVLEVANQPLFDLWNVGPEALGRPFLNILPEMRDQVFEKLLKNVYRTGEAYFGFETPVVFHRKNGIKETVYVNFVYQPYRTKDNVITGVIVLASNVTDQVIAKQELVKSEARNRLAVEAAQLGTYEVDINRQTIFHNERTAQIFGFPPSYQIAYGTMIKHIHPDDIEIRNTAHAVAREKGELFYEVRIIRANNEIRWIRLNGKYISKEIANDFLIGTIFDITEEKRAAELLEQKINERTKELVRANEQLEKSNLELEQFAHISSHDLQEPLRKITLFANMTIKQGNQNLDDKTKRNLDKIKESAQRMSASLTALLNYSELKKVEEFVGIDVDKVVTGILSDLEMLIAEKEGRVVRDRLPVIKGIPHQIQQLFYNLINNACKFSRQDVAPVIQIHFKEVDGTHKEINTDAATDYWEFIIEDNGVGFEQKFADRIFSMFQRLHNKEAYGGTGIGLALCKKVVENHKGFIWAVAEPNKGAQFHVILPKW